MTSLTSEQATRSRGVKAEWSKKSKEKGIDNVEKRIREHENKIADNPNSRDVPHWKKEIDAFKKGIDNLRR